MELRSDSSVKEKMNVTIIYKYSAIFPFNEPTTDYFYDLDKKDCQ
jgi:hypothetical protein